MASQTAERPGRNDMQNARSRPDRASEGENGEDFYGLISEVSSSCQKYCASRPRVVAGAIFGLGFIIGWKLKPW